MTMAPEVIIRSRRKRSGDESTDMQEGMNAPRSPASASPASAAPPNGDAGASPRPTGPPRRIVIDRRPEPVATMPPEGGVAEPPPDAEVDTPAGVAPAPTGEESFAALFAASEAAQQARPRLAEGARVRGRVI